MGCRLPIVSAGPHGAPIIPSSCLRSINVHQDLCVQTLWEAIEMPWGWEEKEKKQEGMGGQGPIYGPGSHRGAYTLAGMQH